MTAPGGGGDAPGRRPKILVTGSSGFIARFLLPHLLEEGASVVGLDVRPPVQDPGPGFEDVRGDICDPRVVGEVMAGVDEIIHLAAEHQDFGVATERYFAVNRGGMEVLLQTATEAGVDRFVFFSSVAVYGEGRGPSHEEMEPAPTNPYGASKLEAEVVLREWAAAQSGRTAVVLRPTVVFGPHNYANMFRLIDQIAKGRYLQIGAGDNVKSLAYVENVAAATQHLRRTAEPGLHVYNYADGPHLTSRTIAETVAEALDVPLPRLRLPRALALGLAYPLDVVAAVTGRNLPITSKRIGKFTAATRHAADRIVEAGFDADRSTLEGLREMVRWYRTLPTDGR